MGGASCEEYERVNVIFGNFLPGKSRQDWPVCVPAGDVKHASHKQKERQ
jgi:hypothetical protein